VPGPKGPGLQSSAFKRRIFSQALQAGVSRLQSWEEPLGISAIDRLPLGWRESAVLLELVVGQRVFDVATLALSIFSSDTAGDQFLYAAVGAISRSMAFT
jgi:hypothetical protein